AGPQAPYTFATQPECLACLGAFRNRNGTPASKRGHFQLAAQSGSGKRYGQLAVQIVTITLENCVLLQMNFNIEIARRPSVDARLAIATGANTHTVVDTRRDFHFER